MKETEKQKQIKEDLKSLEMRAARLSKEINEAMSEIIVRQELRLVQEALDKLKESYEC